MNNLSKINITFALLLLSAITGFSSNISMNSKPYENIIEELRKEMQREEMTSISFAVIKNDKLILSDALGYADRNRNIPASTDTRYLVASISKTITCVALLQLYEQNLFSLDDDINSFLPFAIRNPLYPNNKITFRMLLSHYSGISDVNQDKLDLYCYGYDCTMNLAEYFDNVFSPDGLYFSTQNFSKYKPGTKEDYSNLGMALVGYLVERISNQPFDTYCKDHIFMPLGMTKTEWRLADTPLNELAIPYSVEITNSNPHFTFPDYPNGGLRTTAEDLSIFLRAIAMNGSFNGIQILKPTTIDIIKTLQFGSQKQALTFYYSAINGQSVIGHNGSEMGVTTEMYFEPVNKIGVIILNNDDDANLEKLLSLLFKYGEEF